MRHRRTDGANRGDAMRKRGYGRTYQSREILARYPGKCACCGGAIAVGELVTFYPGRGVGHLLSLEGNSAKCAAVLRETRFLKSERAGYDVDPGELAADRWTESHS